MFSSLTTLLFAKDAAPDANPLWQFMPFILIFVLLYLIVLRPAQKREQTQRALLLSSLKKNDKVLTSGGIIGIVALVNDKEDEITLKVDESSNVRIRVLKSSIIKNYTSEEAARDQAAKDKADKGTSEAITAAKS
jgi:preprotein translocase subunit YajC